MKLAPTKSKAKATKTTTVTEAEKAELIGSSESELSSLPLSESEQVDTPSEQTGITDNLPDYSGLDEFVLDADKTSDTDENDKPKSSENISEESTGMSQKDCIMIASAGVSKFELLASVYVGESVVIPDSQKEDIADKAAVVIKKHFGDAELPPWLAKWKEEISLGLALGTCIFSIYQQKKKVDAKLEKEELESNANDFGKKDDNQPVDFNSPVDFHKGS